MFDCLKAVGMPEENAAIIADNLLEADKRGLYSHGMNRLGKVPNVSLLTVDELGKLSTG
nr:unnamed protein product [Callosobruchus chinensis]